MRPISYHLRSFRVRITLFSVLVFAIIFLLTGFGLRHILYNKTLEGIDQELKVNVFQSAPRLTSIMRYIEDKQIPDGEMSRIRKEFEGLMIVVTSSESKQQFVNGTMPKSLIEKMKIYGQKKILPDSYVRPDRKQRPERPSELETHPQPPFNQDKYERPGLNRGPRPDAPFGRHGPRRDFNMPPPIPLKLGDLSYETIHLDSDEYRLAAVKYQSLTLVYAQSLKIIQEEIQNWMRRIIPWIPVVFLSIIAGSWFIASRAIRPTEKLTKTANVITASDLGQRIALENEDSEFVELITVFNKMLDRLERSFYQANRFSADASHELKTPLTVIQGLLEESLRNAPDESPEQQLYSSLLEETQRLKNITQKLLLLSKSDTGQLTLNKKAINFSALINTTLEDTPIFAPHLILHHNVEPDIWIDADLPLFSQIINNLMSNAIKYNNPDGSVSVSLKKNENNTVLSVTNSGSPIPKEAVPHIFDRFFRVDKSRNKRVDGNGLGLSLAREIASAHGGSLELEENEIDKITFTLKMKLHTPHT